VNDVFKALADPSRRRILEILRNGDLSAGEIAAHFEISKPAISKHFKILKAADLIQSRREGTTIVYRLNVSLVEEALMGLLAKLDARKPKRAHAHTEACGVAISVKKSPAKI